MSTSTTIKNGRLSVGEIEGYCPPVVLPVEDGVVALYYSPEWIEAIPGETPLCEYAAKALREGADVRARRIRMMQVMSLSTEDFSWATFKWGCGSRKGLMGIALDTLDHDGFDYFDECEDAQVEWLKRFAKRCMDAGDGWPSRENVERTFEDVEKDIISEVEVDYEEALEAVGVIPIPGSPTDGAAMEAFEPWSPLGAGRFIELALTENPTEFPPDLWNPDAGILVSLFKNVEAGLMPEVHLFTSITPAVARVHFAIGAGEVADPRLWGDLLLQEEDRPNDVPLAGCGGDKGAKRTPELVTELARQVAETAAKCAAVGPWYAITGNGDLTLDDIVPVER